MFSLSSKKMGSWAPRSISHIARQAVAFFEYLLSFSTIYYLLHVSLFLFSFTGNYWLSTQDISVISTTYFPSSKGGYPANTMAILFSSQKTFWVPRPLLCISRNATNQLASFAKIRYALSPVDSLRCEVVKNPSVFGITDAHHNSKTVVMPYRNAIQKQLGVVACFAPLFYNERWQLIITTLEIYRQMGVDLQDYYVQSMISDVFDFLKVYERLDIVKITAWNKLVLNPERLRSLGYDPNIELEWRGQAMAHTDCFLHYKQSAEFIIIADIDDILFPKLGRDYLSEFRFLTANFPYASGFSYNRYNTEIVSTQKHEDFSLSELINSARISNQWEDGKYVVVPKHVETTWLHWPSVSTPGYNFYNIDDKLNIMVHLRNWSIVNNDIESILENRRNFGLFRHQITHYVNSTGVSNLERNFHEFLQKHALREYGRLPRGVNYYPLIEKCYDEIFYSRNKKVELCPGPLRCNLPPIKGLKCAVSKKRYSHKSMNTRVTWHFPIDTENFIVNSDGCNM